MNAARSILPPETTPVRLRVLPGDTIDSPAKAVLIELLGQHAAQPKSANGHLHKSAAGKHRIFLPIGRRIF